MVDLVQSIGLNVDEISTYSARIAQILKIRKALRELETTLFSEHPWRSIFHQRAIEIHTGDVT